MKVDVTRDSFDLSKAFTRVLLQQGRVQLDSEWNEQVSIFWQFIRTLTCDLLGPYAGPEHNCGFGVLTQTDPLVEGEMTKKEQQKLQESIREGGDFLIGPGNYYVNGILCTNHHFLHFSKQSHFHHSMLPKNNGFPYLVYLDVWEREVSVAEDDSIREVALKEIDTAARARVVWQVKCVELKNDQGPLSGVADGGSVRKKWQAFVDDWRGHHRGRLRAKAHAAIEEHDSPGAAPTLGYRGLQNQLYRVEIHSGGRVGPKDGATFKWSRENGSIVFPIVSMTDSAVTVRNLGRDFRTGLKVGDWIEVIDDDYTLRQQAEPLRQVEGIVASRSEVILNGKPTLTGANPDKHPFLRRWDHKQGDPRRGGLDLRDGAAIIKEGGDGDKLWLTLEDGVQVQFSVSDPPHHYRTGDYWLIPARTAIGDVLWPRADGEPEALNPHGITHHFAPIAIVSFNGNALETQGDCRPKFGLHMGY